MIQPLKAAVRPRVNAGQYRGIMLLEDLVSEFASASDVSEIELYGPPASGTTTALQHLAFVFADDSSFQIDELERFRQYWDVHPAGRIIFSRSSGDRASVLKFVMAGWGCDEWIEYMLSVDKPHCASVIKRVQNDPDVRRLNGNPSVLRQVLDEMAADDELPDVKSALLRIVEKRFDNPDLRRFMEDRVFAAEISSSKTWKSID